MHYMKERNALCLLLLTSLIWGFAFVAQSEAADSIGPLTYNGIRMLIGSAALLPLAYKNLRKHLKDKRYRAKLFKAGIICASCLGTASVLQQAGIAGTTAGKAGFITSLYMLIVPILSIILKKKVSKKVWACVFSGLLGAYLLSINEGFSISQGDFLVFLCSIVFALHIMAIDIFGKDVDGVELSMMQFFFAGIACLLMMFFFEDVSIKAIEKASVAILYSGIMSCGVAYTLQIVAQKYVSPAPATLAMSLESVWAAVGGALMLGERMSTKEMLGCLILFVSVVIAQLPDRIRKTSE